MQVLQHNWGWKLLSLLGAVVLTLFVQRQQDVTQTTIVKPLRVQPGPGLRTDTPKGEVEVRIDLSGPGELIRNIDTNDVTVLFDVSTLRAGRLTAVPVRVELARQYEGRVTHDWRPRAVQVRMAAETTREFPVIVETASQVEGWAWREVPKTEPGRVTVAGTDAALAAVTRVSAVFAPGARELVSSTVALQAQNSAGSVIPDVRIEPAQVLVTGMQHRVVINKRIPVQPVFTPPPGMRVEVRVTPTHVLATGPEQLLSPLYVMETPALQAPRGAGEVTRDVTLNSPHSAIQLQPSRVKVWIKTQSSNRRP